MTTSSKPIGLMAPWWSDLKKATADGRVTKPEVKKLIETHRDQFGNESYRAALEGLLAGGKAPARLTRGAKQELQTALAPGHFRFPGKDQLARIYGSIVHTAMDHGTAKLLDHAPEGYRDAPSFNITPRGVVDANQVVYDVKGELYLAMTGFAGRTFWYQCGRAPMF